MVSWACQTFSLTWTAFSASEIKTKTCRNTFKIFLTAQKKMNKKQQQQKKTKETKAKDLSKHKRTFSSSIRQGARKLWLVVSLFLFLLLFLYLKDSEGKGFSDP